ARTWALNEYVNLLHAVLHRLACCRLCCHLRCEWSGLTGSLETNLSGRGPRDNSTGWIRDAHDGVVEGRLNVSVALGHVLLDYTTAGTARRGLSLLSHLLLLLSCDRLLRTLTRTRIGLGTLTTDWQATTVAQTLVATDFNLATNVSLNLTA